MPRYTARKSTQNTHASSHIVWKLFLNANVKRVKRHVSTHFFAKQKAACVTGKHDVDAANRTKNRYIAKFLF